MMQPTPTRTGISTGELTAQDPPGFRRGDIRVSDTERDQAVARLSGYFEVGRLTLEEFEDRSGRALQARTEAELSGLFTDLPQHTAPDPAGQHARLSPGWLVVIGCAVACAIALVTVGGVLSGIGHGHASLGLPAPAVLVGLVILRRARRRR